MSAKKLINKNYNILYVYIYLSNFQEQIFYKLIILKKIKSNNIFQVLSSTS
jgi:hypothetical protein